MATAYYEILSIKFTIHPHSTEVEVVCSNTNEGTLGVAGPHKKLFPPERTAVDIMQNEIAKAEYLLW